VGVIVGTYSSIFIASPIVVYFNRRFGSSMAVAKSKSYPREPKNYTREAVSARR